MKSSKNRILWLLGLVVSTLPPAICVGAFFPVWRERGAETVLSGLSLLLMLICAVPIIRAIKRALRSPSAPLIWFLVFVAFFSLSKIANDVTVIAFTGFVSNLIGALFFKLSEKGTVNQTNEK